MIRSRASLIACAILAVITATTASAADTYPSAQGNGQVTLEFGIPITSTSPDSNIVKAYCAIGGMEPTSSTYVNVGTIGPGSAASPSHITGTAFFTFTTSAESAAKNSTYGCSVIATDTVKSSMTRGSTSGTWDDAGTTPGVTAFTIAAPAAPATAPPTATPTATPSPKPTVAPTPTPMLTPGPSSAPIKFTVGVSVSVSNIEVGSKLLMHCVITAPSSAFGADIAGDAAPQTKTASNTFYGAGVTFVVPGSFAAANPSGTCTVTIAPFAPQSFNVEYLTSNVRTFSVSPSYNGSTLDVGGGDVKITEVAK